MLNLTRVAGQSVHLRMGPHLVEVRVWRVDSRGKVWLSFSAPKEVNIWRSELSEHPKGGSPGGAVPAIEQ